RSALVDDPVKDQRRERDTKEDLVAILGTHRTLARRNTSVDGAERIGERPRRGFAVVAKVAATTLVSERLEARLIQAAGDLSPVRVHEHLLELALPAVHRNRATLGCAAPH